MQRKAIIFDVDGTLAETEEAHRHAFNQAFAEFGLDWNWDTALYRRLLRVSGGKERMRAFVAEHGARIPAGDPAGGTTGSLDDLVDALHRRKTELYTARVATGCVPLRPGIARLIAQAHAAGLVLAVATTTTRANVAALMAGTGLAPDWFATMACADDAPLKKPHPQVYTLVLDRLGLPAPSCLAVEDSANGLRAARAAGIAVVVTPSLYTADDDFAGAHRIWPDLGAVELSALTA